MFVYTCRFRSNLMPFRSSPNYIRKPLICIYRRAKFCIEDYKLTTRTGKTV